LGEKSLKEVVVGKAMLEVQNDDETLPNFTETKSKTPSCNRWRLRSWRASPPDIASSIYTFTLKYVDVQCSTLIKKLSSTSERPFAPVHWDQ